jgi:hypothetical protein
MSGYFLRLLRENKKLYNTEIFLPSNFHGSEVYPTQSLPFLTLIIETVAHLPSHSL